MSSLLTADVVSFEELYSPHQNIDVPIARAFAGWLAEDVTLDGTRVDHTATLTGAPHLHPTGHVVGGVNDFLYGRIYVDPSYLDLGNLVSSQSRTFTVWNATFNSHVVTLVTAANDTGLVLTPPSDTPYTLAPLQQVTYALSISVTGPTTLDALYTLTIGGAAYTVEVVGSRVVLWPFPPNWASPVNESLEWLTDVLKAKVGNEQRIALRTRPRRQLAYDFQLFRADTQYFDNILWGWQNRAFAVPYWPYRARTTAPIVAGSEFIPCDTTRCGFAVGQLMALVLSTAVYEVIEVLALSPTGLTLSSPTLRAWPKRSAVYPCAVSRLVGNVAVQRASSQALNGSVTFLAQPAASDPFIPVEAASMTLDGVEVITQQPDWSSPIDVSATFEFDTVDFAVGDTNYALTDTTQSLAYRYRWILKNRTAVNHFRAFLGRLKGQLNPVYIPSWHEDFTLTRDILPSDTTLTVLDHGFLALVGVNPARNQLYIRTRLGHFLRPILSAGPGAGNTAVIGIGTPLGISISVAQVWGISYVSKYRKSTDSVTVQWQTDEVAIVEDTFQLVAA